MRILVAVDERALARWVVQLVETLRNLPGTEACLAVADTPGSTSSALPTLLALEKIVVRGHRPCGADRIGRGDIDAFLLEPHGFQPDIVIDLSEMPAGYDNIERLRPLYDGQAGETALASALFFRGTPEIAIERFDADRREGRIVAGGTASLEAASGIGGGIEAVTSRVIMLLKKAIAAGGNGDVTAKPHAIRPITRKDIATRTAKDVARAAVRAAYRLCCHGSHWRVGWRFTPPGQDVWTRRDLGGGRWNVLRDPVDHFYADPFPLHWQGRDYIFFEDLDHRKEKGVIAVTALDEKGRPGPAMQALEEPWHLSYPFLIERAGEIFMIPETSGNRDIALYRSVEFPLRWERHAVLVDNVEAADATIVQHGDLFYLFAVVRDGTGGYSDTLAIWWAKDILGPWMAHAQNPVLVDDRTARPAGNFVYRDGALYRPVQDCRRAYGAALGLMKVSRLDTERFVQQPVATIEAGGPWPGRRIHTLNYNGRLETIDGFTLRPRLKPLADLVDRWYEPSA